jgi:phage baseplate assembly protein W
MQNCVTLLHTERGELFGDPYYGLLFKHYLFDQNSPILADVLIDIIYTQVALFIPQLKLNRNLIKIIADKERGQLYCTFTAQDQIDFTIDTYQLLLYKMERNS